MLDVSQDPIHPDVLPAWSLRARRSQLRATPRDPQLQHITLDIVKNNWYVLVIYKALASNRKTYA